jgi:hypothetical protein
VIDLDEPLWWFVCGDEGGACIYGPYRLRDVCEAHAQGAACDHHHAMFERTPRLVARMLVQRNHPLRGSRFSSIMRLVHRGGNEWVEVAAACLRTPETDQIYDEMVNYVASPEYEEEELPTLPPRVLA